MCALVTGVQTCALPICAGCRCSRQHSRWAAGGRRRSRSAARQGAGAALETDDAHAGAPAFRASEHHRTDAARCDHARAARGPPARPFPAAAPHTGPGSRPRLRPPACPIPACERIPMTKAYDALIIGAGHNGLVCAFYLAKAGLKVRIVEARDRSEEHTSELQSLMRISYAVFCLTKKKENKNTCTTQCTKHESHIHII